MDISEKDDRIDIIIDDNNFGIYLPKMYILQYSATVNFVVMPRH